MNSKVDTHVHTYFSGVSNYKVLRFPESITKPETQVDCARKNGMNVLCITDHDAVKGAFEAQKYAKQFDDIEVVIGEEVTSADGEVLAYWLNELVPPGLPIEETLDLIHDQGGLAGITYGTLKGVVYVIAREIVGVVDIITFPFPLPGCPRERDGYGWGYGPIMRPAWVVNADHDWWNFVYDTNTMSSVSDY